mgnify:CR=1 FL=1
MSLYNSTNSFPVVIPFNSKDRVSGNVNSFTSSPTDVGVNTFDSVVLLAASIPKSWFNVPSNYNTVTLTEKAVNTTITPPTNFTATWTTGYTGYAYGGGKYDGNGSTGVVILYLNQ